MLLSYICGLNSRLEKRNLDYRYKSLYTMLCIIYFTKKKENMIKNCKNYNIKEYNTLKLSNWLSINIILIVISKYII